MLRSLFTWFLLLTTALLMAACCGSVACECNDGYADAVALKFDMSSTNSFKPAELETVYAVRRLLPDTAKVPKPDTVVITRTPDQARTQDIIISNTAPFVANNNRRVNQYQYTVYLGTRRRPTYSVVVDTVELAGRYQADGCCTCYQNTKKVVHISGQQPFDATDPTGKNQLVPFLLKR
jgi:hypothetical protein